jgi:glycine/D-amino acid oxidase-like deaminating enzyme
VDWIRPTRQEVFFFGVGAGDPAFAPPAMPAWVDFKEQVYGVPDLEGRGFKLAIDAHGPPFDPDSGERLATAEGLALAREHLARLLPSLRDAPVVETRVCQYENTPNGDFLIDRHPDFENVGSSAEARGTASSTARRSGSTSPARSRRRTPTQTRVSFSPPRTSARRTGRN